MGRSTRWYIIVLLLLGTSVQAQMPPHVDSLMKYMSFRTRIEIPSNDTGRWNWALNTAIQQVCTELPALPKLDTVTLRQDSTGSALNADFDRVRWVMKIDGTKKWIPLGNVEGDTIFLQTVDTSSAGMKQVFTTEPRLYMTHGIADTIGDPSVMKLFTHQKYARDTIAATFIVAYYARDTWLRSGTAPESTSVRWEYRDEIVELGASLIFKGRQGIAVQ